MENKVDYLRLSLTDKCNLNCVYCTPLEKEKFLGRDEVLSYEEITKAVSLFVDAGIRKVRLTGGEPLIKKDIDVLIGMLSNIEGLEEISMTTNGVYLKNLAVKLKHSGLDRINISIDTLNKERFKSITGFDSFDSVWSGIKEALEIGLSPVKLNVILMKGINDDEISDFAQLSLDYPLAVRFIEFFPTNKRSMKFSGCLLNNGDVKKEITEKFGAIEIAPWVKGNGPAEYFKLKGSKGLIGFISSSSGNFCDDCNRIRMDCAGRISPCLFSGPILDMRELLRPNLEEDKLLSRIKEIFIIKPRYNKNKIADPKIEMSSIGG